MDTPWAMRENATHADRRVSARSDDTRGMEMTRRTGALTACAAVVVAATAVVATASQFAGKPSFTEAGQFGQLQLAQGATTAPDGRLFVADTNNARIQVFSATGSASGSWGGFGNGAGKFSSPRDIDIAPDGNVWVADYNNSRLQELRPDGSSVRVINQTLLSPGVAVDADGNVYATRSGGNGAGTVWKYDKAANYAPSQIAGGLLYPGHVETSPDGSLYVANEGQGRRVVRYDLTGKQLGTIPVGASNPIALAVDPDCNIWVGDIGQRRLVKYSPAGKSLGELKPKTETIAFGATVGPTGTLYVLNAGKTVLRLTEDRKPGVALVPSKVAATKTPKGYVAKIAYTLAGIACPSEVGATAAIAGKGLTGKASGLKLPIGKKSVIEIPLKGSALKAGKGRTVPVTFTIVLQTNGRPTTEIKKTAIAIPK